MSDAYTSAEQQFCSSLNTLRKNNQIIPNLSKENKEGAINESRNNLAEAERALKELGLEVAMISGEIKSQLQVQNRRYKEDFDKTKKVFSDLEQEYLKQKNKETLMGSRLQDSKNNHKEKLLGADVIQDQNMKIAEGLGIAREAENQAIGTMNELNRNRQTINHAMNGARQVDDNLAKGNRVITSMTRRALQNKIVMFAVVLLLLIAIGAVIYVKMS